MSKSLLGESGQLFGIKVNEMEHQEPVWQQLDKQSSSFPDLYPRTIEQLESFPFPFRFKVFCFGGNQFLIVINISKTRFLYKPSSQQAIFSLLALLEKYGCDCKASLFAMSSLKKRYHRRPSGLTKLIMYQFFLIWGKG